MPNLSDLETALYFVDPWASRVVERAVCRRAKPIRRITLARITRYAYGEHPPDTRAGEASTRVARDVLSAPKDHVLQYYQVPS